MSVSLTLITVPQTREELADQLESDGYMIGRPAHVTRDCIAIDQQIANEATCDECGVHGLEFLPFRPKDRQQRNYRAMAWCCLCDSAFEL
jgi:hypothetical protein